MATVNKTFRLHEDVVQYLAERVRDGDAPSQTALIEKLVRREKELRELYEWRRVRAEEYKRAWSDPAYVAEQEQIEREFEEADYEAWKMVDLGDPDPNPESDPQPSAGRSSARTSAGRKGRSGRASGPR